MLIKNIELCSVFNSKGVALHNTMIEGEWEDTTNWSEEEATSGTGVAYNGSTQGAPP